MELRKLGRSDLQVSRMGLGCNQLGNRVDAAGTLRIVDAALEAGINFFDTADIYSNGLSEEYLGAALRGRRDQVLVASKFGFPLPGYPSEPVGSRAYVRHAVEASLRRLGIDHLDLYQFHHPDPETPVEETLSALAELVAEGKVRWIGSSQFAGWQVADAEWVSRTRDLPSFISTQHQYSLLHQAPEQELVEACAHFEVARIPFYPLALGMLAGKYHRGQAPPPGTRLSNHGRASTLLVERNFAVVDGLTTFAERNGVSLLEVALGGLAAMPGVGILIPGATSPEQVIANAAAAAWTPSPGQLQEIVAITNPS